MKFVVRGKEPEPVVEFWLEESSAGVRLRAQRQGTGVYTLMDISPEGVHLYNGVPPTLGIKVKGERLAVSP